MEAHRFSEQIRAALRELFSVTKAKEGEILVVGCSTSEILGKRIGSCSSEEVAEEIVPILLSETRDRGLFLAVQGCEHINRCLCVSRECAERHSLEPVWVKPWLHAGGACAATAFQKLPEALMVESLKAQASLGLDIGDTLIGMHLRPVAVPVRCELRRIGEANLVIAISRPKYVGGPRAQYSEK